jgi:hypothetical protein
MITNSYGVGNGWEWDDFCKMLTEWFQRISDPGRSLLLLLDMNKLPPRREDLFTRGKEVLSVQRAGPFTDATLQRDVNVDTILPVLL